jgi:hypothetical protein
MWVAAALIGCSVVTASIIITHRLVPDSSDLRQINLYRPIAGVIVGMGLLIVGLVERDLTLIGWGTGLVAVFALLSVWIFRRPRS